jgi:hypothetical protein
VPRPHSLKIENEKKEVWQPLICASQFPMIMKLEMAIFATRHIC